ncbi:platelet-activating factor acetylhydrolase [Stylonychia lemnae]|uniref:1-alkyl-2-acetylglycerophosphocholine esterase n=1 Tax=Stylonychia lemnae TaxID=5949 RepID=A0A078AMJ4_STYLE|nr:platelet-activating factor acetylhydrolase [Stylonychia lemnae]|eukprot:CDW83146.1 platelet-activating factor acetylhydrolase [Stylonychia lemnae]
MPELHQLLYFTNIISIFFGLWYEGIRMCQFPNVISILFVSSILELYRKYFLLKIINVILFSISLIGFFMFGDYQFERYPKGFDPYRVGFKKIKSDKNGNTVGVFYPIDIAYYEKHKNDKKFYKLDRSVYSELMKGFSNLFQLGQKETKEISSLVMRPMMNHTLDIIENAPLAAPFLNREKELIPIVFSHSLGGYHMSQTMTMMDYAKHGYIVFGPDHQDGSCLMTFDKDGKVILFDNKHKIAEKPIRVQQLNRRVEEIITFMDELLQQNIVEKKLGFLDIKFATDKLIISGMSFGGITALKVAQKDMRPRAVLVFDPWLFPCFEEIYGGGVKIFQPIQVIFTEYFPKFTHPLDIFGCMKKLLDDSMNLKNEVLILKTGYHTDIVDYVLFQNLEFTLIEKRELYFDRHDIYFTANQLALHYLAKLDNATSHSAIEILKQLDFRFKKYVKYDLEYDPSKPLDQNQKDIDEQEAKIIKPHVIYPKQ